MSQKQGTECGYCRAQRESSSAAKGEKNAAKENCNVASEIFGVGGWVGWVRVWRSEGRKEGRKGAGVEVQKKPHAPVCPDWDADKLMADPLQS